MESQWKNLFGLFCCYCTPLIYILITSFKTLFLHMKLSHGQLVEICAVHYSFVVSALLSNFVAFPELVIQFHANRIYAPAIPATMMA